MPKALLLLVVLLLGVGGPALAQSHFKDAVKGAVQGSTLDEIIAWSDAQFARRAAVGRYVRWGGHHFHWFCPDSCGVALFLS